MNGRVLIPILVLITILIAAVVLKKNAQRKEKEREERKRQKQRAEYEKCVCDAQQEFLSRAKKFYGLLGYLNESVIKKDAEEAEEMLERWRISANGMPNLARVSEEICKSDALAAAAFLLQQLEKWGVRHDAAGEILAATDALNKLYIMDAYYAEGQHLIVKKPAWYCQVNGNIICIENGIAELYEEK